MTNVLCFGELLLRFSPQIGGVWLQKNQMPVFVGGAELNVATALSHWEMPVQYCTTLPPNYLSQELITSIRNRGINADKIFLSGKRIGSYYLPQGADMQNAGVLYDRAHSAFSELKPGQIDWDVMLDGIDWFNLSAISPALNQNVADVCVEGMKAARSKNIMVSLDLNHRPRLWNWGRTPAEVMPALVEQCDLLMGNIWAAATMLGIELQPNLKDDKDAYLEQATTTSQSVLQQFPNCKTVANTFRFDRANGLRYYAALYNARGLVVSEDYQTKNVIDRVGSGDTFMAGLIYSHSKGLSAKRIIDFAATAAFNKLFITGDSTTNTVEDIEKAIADHV